MRCSSKDCEERPKPMRKFIHVVMDFAPISEVTLLCLSDSMECCPKIINL